MTTLKAWAVAVAALFVVGILVIIGGAKTIFASFWVMVAVLWLLFILMVSTVVSRRAKRGDRS
jgi:uncharacterized membrane protein